MRGISRVAGAGCTHAGRRAANEDAYGVDEASGVFVVADGMGGYEGGALASRLTVDTMRSALSGSAEPDEATRPTGGQGDRLLTERRHLRSAVRRTASVVEARRQGTLAQMGSTLVALVFRKGHALVAHVGDSRAYRLRGGSLERLTSDHATEARRAAGAESGAGAMLTRAIGVPGRADPDIAAVPTETGDVFVLCTDGLTGVLDEAQITATLAELPPRQAAATLVARAHAAGAHDNVTAVVAHVGP